LTARSRNGRSRATEQVEVQGERSGADPPDVRRLAQPVIQASRGIELAVHRLAGEKHVIAIEHLRVREAAGAKQLRLGDLEKTHVGAVEDDAREIHVRPADILFDDERRDAHSFPDGGPSGKLEDLKLRRQLRGAPGAATPGPWVRGSSARRAGGRKRAAAATAWCG